MSFKLGLAFALIALPCAYSLQCNTWGRGTYAGLQTCGQSVTSCWKTYLDGVGLAQGCDTGNYCSMLANANSCCTVPGSGQKVICSSSTFTSNVSDSDFSNCGTTCTQGTPAPTAAPTFALMSMYNCSGSDCTTCADNLLSDTRKMTSTASGTCTAFSMGSFKAYTNRFEVYGEVADCSGTPVTTVSSTGTCSAATIAGGSMAIQVSSFNAVALPAGNYFVVESNFNTETISTSGSSSTSCNSATAIVDYNPMDMDYSNSANAYTCYYDNSVPNAPWYRVSKSSSGATATNYYFDSYSTCTAQDGLLNSTSSQVTTPGGSCQTNDVGTLNTVPYPSVSKYSFMASTGAAAGSTSGTVGNTVYFSSDIGLNSNSALKTAYEKGYGAAVGLYDTSTQQYYDGCSVSSDYTVYNRRTNSYQLAYYGKASAAKLDSAASASVSLSTSSYVVYLNQVLQQNGQTQISSADVTSIQVSAPSSDSSSSSSGLSTGAIVGIVIGCVVFICIIAFVVFFFCCRDSKAKQQEGGKSTAVVEAKVDSGDSATV